MTPRDLADLAFAGQLVGWLIDRPEASPKVRATWAATAAQYLVAVAERERKEAESSRA